MSVELTMHATPLIKFCGLTRAEDAAAAVQCGAAYLGVIFAGGPRAQAPERARELLGSTGTTKRVGVFGPQDADAIGDVAAGVGLDVVQLHGDPTADDVLEVRSRFRGEVWGVLRLRDAGIPAHARDLAAASDALVLDAQVPGALGGTGTVLPWRELAADVGALRRGTRLVLAGGLTPANVGAAIVALAPDVVDVSSGVESAPGIKDHERLRAFRDAVHAARHEAGQHG